MAERLRYKSQGQPLRLPQLQFAGAAADAQGKQQVANSLGQMSSFFLQQTNIQAQAQGETYGAMSAPTAQQLKTAYDNKTEVDMPGGDATVFDRAAKVAALNATSDQLQVLARKQITEIVLAAYKSQSSPGQLAEDIDAVVVGYAGTLRTDAPGLAQSFQAKMSLYANSQYESYSRSLLTGTTTAALEALTKGRLLRLGQVSKSMYGAWRD